MSEYLKPQSPIKYKKDDAYIYPLTTADQVILEDNNRLNFALERLDEKQTEMNALLDAKADASLLDTKQEKHNVISASLPTSNWSSMEQTVTINGVTENNTIVVTPASENHTAYCEAGVYCSTQANGTLIFTCLETPSSDLTVNVLILD